MDQHLSWNTYVDSLLTSSYGTLSVLRRLKNLAPFHVRKPLAESPEFSLTPEQFLHGISSLASLSRKTSPTATEYVCWLCHKKIAGLEDVITFNWLPVKGNVEFNILKLAHKLLYDKNSFPEYLNLSLHQVTAYNLRSSTAPVF